MLALIKVEAGSAKKRHARLGCLQATHDKVVSVRIVRGFPLYSLRPDLEAGLWIHVIILDPVCSRVAH